MTNEERLEEAARILARGGRLVVAKNVGALLAETARPAGRPLPFGVTLQVCQWLPDDTVLAISPEADSDRLALKFACPEPAPAPVKEDGHGA